MADQEKYRNDELNSRAYPTHLVIDKKGQVVKIVDQASEIIYVLDREASKKIVQHDSSVYGCFKYISDIIFSRKAIRLIISKSDDISDFHFMRNSQA